jgi:hypothetical protein
MVVTSGFMPNGTLRSQGWLAACVDGVHGAGTARGKGPRQHHASVQFALQDELRSRARYSPGVDEQAEITEVFAHFGAAMHQAQCVETQAAICAALLETPHDVHAYAYADRLHRYLRDTLDRIVERLELFTAVADLVPQLRDAVEKRNWLAHRYFRDRMVEFTTAEGRVMIVHELSEIEGGFSKLDAALTALTHSHARERGVTEDAYKEALAELLSNAGTPHDNWPAPLQKQMEVVSLLMWDGNPVFRARDGLNLVLGDMGLVHYDRPIPEGELRTAMPPQGSLPAAVVLRPKGASKWQYTLVLAAGYELQTQPRTDGQPGCQWEFYKSGRLISVKA